jgi:hypothetical protein
MSADDLTSFSYVILLLVGSGGAAPHDLLRMHRQGNWIYWTAAESRFYSEPKRLAQLRYLNARRGRKAIAGWLAEPSGFIRIQNEPAARLNGADLAADEQTVVHSLRAIRPHIDEQLLWLERAEREARGLPHRERYLQINHRLSRRILVAFSDWLDEVEAEFGSSDGQTRVQHRKVRRRGT